MISGWLVGWGCPLCLGFPFEVNADLPLWHGSPLENFRQLNRIRFKSFSGKREIALFRNGRLAERTKQFRKFLGWITLMNKVGLEEYFMSDEKNSSIGWKNFFRHTGGLFPRGGTTANTFEVGNFQTESGLDALLQLLVLLLQLVLKNFVLQPPFVGC